VRRIAIPAALALATGLALVGTESPANAAPGATTITSPTDGSHYLADDAHPNGETVTVTGTTNGEPGDTIDLRCYERPDAFTSIQTGVEVRADRTFTATLPTSRLAGTCLLKAVPAGLAKGAPVTAFTGPRITVEWHVPKKITTGSNVGKVHDYYIAYQGSKAFNDYVSATGGGLFDARLTEPSGFSSQFLWFENASLRSVDPNSTAVRIDGHHAYGPRTAFSANSGAGGFPELSFSTSRNPTTGVTTIHETDPMVYCPGDPFPATPANCPSFEGTGVRLERTIVTDDDGRQVHISDVWRSIDGHAHTLSLHYTNRLEADDEFLGFSTDVGLRLPWLHPDYRTFTGDSVLAGTTKVPATISVRDKVTAPDGDTTFPRGAITLDTAPNQVHWAANSHFVLRDEGLLVPAGGTRVVRHDYVIGTTEAEIAAKAATSQALFNPRRPDLLVKVRKAYAGNGVYNTTGSAQTVTKRQKRRKTATFSVLVQNDGTVTDTFRLKGAGKKKDFTVTYLAGRKDVTRQVVRGTYTLKDLAPGAQRVLKLVIKVKPNAKKGKLRSWLLTSTSVHDTTRTDTVAATLKVKR
jgi:hypothetical protein